MYVSQVSATVLYTVFKTILLFLLSVTITSICAWMNRYDLAKIFEQGNVTVLVGALTSNKYSKYRGMFVGLFIAIAFEIMIGLLPTIATKFMPFENIIINDGVYKYFQTNFNTPVQNVRIMTNQTNMDNYCQDMGLCDFNKIYQDNILNISQSMKVNSIEFNFSTMQFNTEHVNISLPFNQFKNATHDLVSGLNIVINRNDTDITENLMYGFDLLTEYKNRNNSDLTYQTSFLPMIYGKDLLDVISVVHRSDMVYFDENNYILITMKMCFYNGFGPDIRKQNAFNNVFNNSEYLFNKLTDGKISLGENTDTIYTLYNNDNYLAVDIYQFKYRRLKPNFSKVRILYGAYIIQDENFKNTEGFKDIKLITNFNSTYSSLNIENTNYHPMFDYFDDSPSKDIFMYSILASNSDGRMYGIKGNRDVVADISPVFIGIIVAIIILSLTIYIISRYIKDNIYFSTLLETVGISNLTNIISKEDRISLNDKSSSQIKLDIKN